MSRAPSELSIRSPGEKGPYNQYKFFDGGKWTFLGESESEFLDDESVNMFDMATNVDTR